MRIWKWIGFALLAAIAPVALAVAYTAQPPYALPPPSYPRGAAEFKPVAPRRPGERTVVLLVFDGFAPATVRAADTPVCACGSAELALEGGIIGRVDDMVVIRGVNLYPSAMEAVLRRFPEIAEYRVEVRRSGALAEATVQLEPAPACDAPERLCRSVEGALRETFNLRVPVSAVAGGTLPRWELKARRWVLVQEDA